MDLIGVIANIGVCVCVLCKGPKKLGNRRMDRWIYYTVLARQSTEG
jgi:hypothetical protein